MLCVSQQMNRLGSCNPKYRITTDKCCTFSQPERAKAIYNGCKFDVCANWVSNTYLSYEVYGRFNVTLKIICLCRPSTNLICMSQEKKVIMVWHIERTWKYFSIHEKVVKKQFFPPQNYVFTTHNYGIMLSNEHCRKWPIRKYVCQTHKNIQLV